LKTTDELLLLQEKQLACRAVLNVADEEVKDKRRHELGLECVDTLRCIEHLYFLIKTLNELDENPIFQCLEIQALQ
jgi:hypothetical protein